MRDSFDPELFRQCWFLTGPTAGGKSEVGIRLAARIDAEIASLDSMAVYRGLDIGTAKPTSQQQAQVPHHLIDLVEPDASFSIAQYAEAAAEVVRSVTARGRRVLFVGGTPLYLKALLRGMFEGPPANWPLRRELELEAANSAPGHLHARLANVDPDAAARLHPNDTRRLVRALEVFQETGRPISHWQRQFEQPVSREDCRVAVLDWPRDELTSRIDRRVDAMFEAGLVNEVQQLQDSGARLGRTAAQAVGYREVLAHLAGELELENCIEQVKFHTHQFARRQCTWFRSLSECRPLELTGSVHPDTVAEALESLLGERN